MLEGFSATLQCVPRKGSRLSPSSLAPAQRAELTSLASLTSPFLSVERRTCIWVARHLSRWPLVKRCLTKNSGVRRCTPQRVVSPISSPSPRKMASCVRASPSRHSVVHACIVPSQGLVRQPSGARLARRPCESLCILRKISLPSRRQTSSLPMMHGRLSLGSWTALSFLSSSRCMVQSSFAVSVESPACRWGSLRTTACSSLRRRRRELNSSRSATRRARQSYFSPTSRVSWWGNPLSVEESSSTGRCSSMP
mmetsp:Transcript_12192/g.40092  ORF Transcript_12192/g.40092 Transcript_12192/m.40092 type:complete len:253 (+) Transcript_12192:561-1319(+)